MDAEHRKWCGRSLVRSRLVLELDDDEDVVKPVKRRHVKNHDVASMQSKQSNIVKAGDSLEMPASMSTSASAAPRRMSRLRPVTAPDDSAGIPERPPSSGNTVTGAIQAHDVRPAPDSSSSSSSASGDESQSGGCLPLADSGAPACAGKREPILEIEAPQPFCRGHISRVPERLLCDIATDAGCAIEIARLRSTCWPLRRSLALLMPALREEIGVRTCLPGLLPHKASLQDFRTQEEIPWKTIIMGLRRLCLWYRVRHRQNQEMWRNWEAQRHSYMFGKEGRFTDCRAMASSLERRAASDKEDMRQCFEEDLMNLLGLPKISLAVYMRKHGDVQRRLVQHFTRHATKRAAGLAQ